MHEQRVTDRGVSIVGRRAPVIAVFGLELLTVLILWPILLVVRTRRRSQGLR